MRTAIDSGQRGFSLAGTLIALLLCTIFAATLSGWQRSLIQGFVAQRALENHWRANVKRLEEWPLVSPDQLPVQSETLLHGCVSITLFVPDMHGSGQPLRRERCPNLLSSSSP
ncbi:hypothetical protein QNH14_15840 [Apirhabdus apintestini]|nr:hypothetical protein QNH14_15840 [Enterobacteriaceae bacterium CA-0114]